VAQLYQAGKYAEATEIAEESLVLAVGKFGPDHPQVVTSLNNLAELNYRQDRYAEAEPLYKRCLAIDEKALGSGYPDVGQCLNNLALLYNAQDRYAEAEPIFKRALAIAEKALGAEHPDVATELNNLAELYRAQGRYAEAEQLFKRALAIHEMALGADHPDVATAFNNLAGLAIAQGNWARAADYWQHATEIIGRRAEREIAGSEGGSVKGEPMRNSHYILGLIKMTDRLASPGHADRARQGRDMFEKAQWALASEATSPMTQMAARSAKGDAALAYLVRERQDLVAERQVKDEQLIAAKSELPPKRNSDAEKSLNDRLAAIDVRLVVIDARFAKDIPGYASLTSPKPASVAEVQAMLKPNEALVLFLDSDERFKPTPEETFIWEMTKGDMRWVKSELGTKALTESVATLRCGLDAALWDDEAAAARCRDLIKIEPERETGSKRRHITEHEAESYAHRALTAHGLEVPEESTYGARWYVAHWIEEDRARGISICPMAEAFAMGTRSRPSYSQAGPPNDAAPKATSVLVLSPARR
jgi:tetratricopeptide (TPR) repeat protein